MDKILCVAKNYTMHADEMKEKAPESPIFFLKPPSSLLMNPESIDLSSFKEGEIHYELEVVLEVAMTINKDTFEQGVNPLALMGRIGLGLDLTRRELQKKLKENRHPWAMSKAFKGSALFFPLFHGQKITDMKKIPFELYIKNELKQKATIKEMIFSVEQLLKSATEAMDLFPGDLIFTGTPSGVGPLKKKDELRLCWGEEKRNLFIL